MLGQRRSRTYEFEDFYVINIKGRWERGGGGGDVGQRHFRISSIHAPVKHNTELPKRYVGGMGSIPI